MSSSSTFRRARIIGLSATLAAAGLLVAPAPARAGVLDTPLSQTSAISSASGGCTSTGGPSVNTPGTFAADGVPVTTTASTSFTWTKTGDPTDVTTVSGTTTGTITATQAAGTLKTVDLSTSYQTALSSALGTAQACNAQVQVGSVYQAMFDLPTAKSVTVDVTTKGTYAVLALQNTSNPASSSDQSISYFLHSHATKEMYLPAGTYIFQIQGLGIHQAPTPAAPSPATKSGSLAAHVSFEEPGTAKAATSGTGTKYLDLGAARSCAAGSLTGTWKSKAGKGKGAKIKKAVFKVNGAKVRTVKKPKKGSTTTLTGLDPEQSIDVTVALKLVKKGAGTVTVERSYRPCG